MFEITLKNLNFMLQTAYTAAVIDGMKEHGKN